jgi:hypothetical protein
LFYASVTVWMRSVFFWDFTQHRLVFCYLYLGTNWRQAALPTEYRGERSCRNVSSHLLQDPDNRLHKDKKTQVWDFKNFRARTKTQDHWIFNKLYPKGFLYYDLYWRRNVVRPIILRRLHEKGTRHYVNPIKRYL